MCVWGGGGGGGEGGNKTVSADLEQQNKQGSSSKH